MKCRKKLSVFLCFLFLVPATVFAASKHSGDIWRVFILSGQSNMEGQAAIKHLKMLLEDPKTAGTYKHFGTPGKWNKRDDVLIRYTNGDIRNRKGRLTVGYGSRNDRFGPELQFGYVAGDAFKEKVLIIKVAWGGKSLRVDFRPPSSGTEGLEEKHRARAGHYYRELVRLTHETLENLEAHFPEYSGSGYEISGFVWFQGWNDMLDASTHAEYGPNLANLLRDLRTDLGVPDMPMIVGELGTSGPEETIPERYRAKHMSFRRQQESVSKMEEFKGEVIYVPTSPYIVKDGPQFNGGYHYRGRADIMFNIGNAFGKAMLKLVDKTPVDHSKQVAEARKKVQKKYHFWN